MLSFYSILLLATSVLLHSNPASLLETDRVRAEINVVPPGADDDIAIWYLVKKNEVLGTGKDYPSIVPVHERLSVYWNCILRQTDNSSSAADKLYAGYLCSGESSLLLAALYESDYEYHQYIRNEQSDVLEQLGSEDDIFAAHINKASGYPYDPAALFRPRRFGLVDFYIFSGSASYDSELVEPLVSRWHQELTRNGQITRQSDALKMKTVISGYHARLRDYSKVHALTTLLPGAVAMGEIMPLQVMLKRSAFAATVGGYFQTALDIYRQYLLPVSRRITSEEEYLRVTVDYAGILFRLGNVQAALHMYQEVFNHSWQVPDPQFQAALLNNLAVSYLNAGHFEEYVSLQLRSFEQAKSSGAVQAQLRALTNLYIYHWRNQDWVNAQSYLNQALTLATAQGFEREIAEINILFSTYYSNYMRDYEQALYYVNEALRVIDPEQGFSMLVSAKIEKSSILMRMGDFERAIDTNFEMLILVRERGDGRAEFDLNTQLAELLIRSNRLEEVHAVVDWLKSIPDSYLNLQQRSLLTNALANYSIATDSSGDHLDLLRSTVSDIIRAVRLSSDLQSGFFRLEAGYERSFTLLIDELIRLGQTREAIFWIDEIKNLNKAAFINSSLIRSTVLTEEEFLFDVQLTNRIDRLRSEILRASDVDRLALNTELLRLLGEKNTLNNRIFREYTSESLDLRRLQSVMRRDELAIAYQQIDTVMYVVSITRNDLHVERLQITDKLLSLAETVISNLKETRSNLHDLHHLYQAVLSPYLHNQPRRLFIIPDGFMYQIPVEIFPRNPTDAPFQFGMAHYLIEDMAVSYQNSLNDLLRVKTRPRERNFAREYLGVGISQFDFMEDAHPDRAFAWSTLNALPYAYEEIQQSYNLLAKFGNRTRLLDSEGTISNVLSYITDSRIVHIASHSLVYDSEPLFSVIQLFGSKEDDTNGQLHAYELFTQNVRSELVVMSSCESGSGRVISGSGIIGLGRALTYAGAHSMILNLWSVRDRAASNLMTSFFRHLGKHTNKDEALRSAKIEYINTTNSDPSVWGSLVVFGDPGPIYSKGLIWQISLLALLLVSSILFVVYQRRYR